MSIFSRFFIIYVYDMNVNNDWFATDVDNKMFQICFNLENNNFFKPKDYQDF